MEEKHIFDWRGFQKNHLFLKSGSETNYIELLECCEHWFLHSPVMFSARVSKETVK